MIPTEKNVLVITGPTASGKTALSVELAKKMNGEIISADSMQIYKKMNIATAKPSEKEKAGIPHHLMDFLDITESFSVAKYVELASKTADEIISRNKLPIMVGGTGLYISSFVDNIQFVTEQKDDVLRKQLEHQALTQGVEVLYNELMDIDPETAVQIHPNNIGRVVRAIEVYHITGKTMTEHRNLSRSVPSPYNCIMIGLDYHDRQKLYDRINLRVDLMIEEGLLSEAEEIWASPGKQTAMQAIGYKELFPYIEGKVSLEQAIESLKQESRRYAKRQLTWFRRDSRIKWFFMEDYKSKEDFINDVYEYLNSKKLYNA